MWLNKSTRDPTDHPSNLPWPVAFAKHLEELSTRDYAGTQYQITKLLNTNQVFNKKRAICFGLIIKYEKSFNQNITGKLLRESVWYNKLVWYCDMAEICAFER